MARKKYNPYILIGERIKKVRIQMKLERSTFAKKINMTEAEIDSIEAGRTKISMDTLFLISTVLETEMNYFLTGISSNRIIIASNILDKYIETFKFIESLSPRQKQVFSKVLDKLPSLLPNKLSKK